MAELDLAQASEIYLCPWNQKTQLPKFLDEPSPIQNLNERPVFTAKDPEEMARQILRLQGVPEHLIPARIVQMKEEAERIKKEVFRTDGPRPVQKPVG